jgi:hypothetical protein
LRCRCTRTRPAPGSQSGGRPLRGGPIASGAGSARLRQTQPETFAFLGFTFICGKSSRGGFQIKRKTRADRMRAKLKQVKEGLRQRMHRTIAEQGRWLGQVVAGYFRYFAVPTNIRALSAFR